MSSQSSTAPLPDTAIPSHIAIIMDGNGRWAQERQQSRSEGHKAGVQACRSIVKASVKKGIKILSVFAFSSENWRRPSEEVQELMALFLFALHEDLEELHEQNVRLRFIGDRLKLNSALQEAMHHAETLTENNTGLTLVVATNYGGRADIVNATQTLVQKVLEGDLKMEELTEATFEKFLWTKELLPPDLFIRTGGVTRISNFYLWQLSYTELYFTDIHWPDFNEEHFDKAIESYQQRERRFGYTSEQVREMSHA